MEPSLSANIYEVYDAIRSASPVVWNENTRSWMIFSYAAIAGAFRCPQLSNAARVQEMRREFSQVLSEARADAAARVLARQLETSDPPHHTAVRQAFGRELTRIVPLLRPAIHAMLDELESAHGWRFPLDLVSAVANPLPLRVVLEALGIERDARPGFGEDVAAFLRHLSDASIDGEDVLARIHRGVAAAPTGLLAELARQAPGLDPHDLVANAILIVSAGHRTTANLIGSLLFLLLRDRPVLEAVVSDPRLIAGAVEEALRLESPIQSLQRTAVAPLEIGGMPIAAGDSITLVIGAANRDPERFPNPCEFQPRRSPNGHLAFGLGTHFCLGAALARLQAGMVVERLLPRLNDLTIVAADWRDDVESRGLARLLVQPA